MDHLHSLTLADISAENAAGFAHRVAAVDGDARLTFAELDTRARQCASLLSEAGVAAGDRVVWAAQNSFRYIECLIASAYLGAVFCPLNWRQSADELAFVLHDTEPRAVIWQESEIGDTVLAARDLLAAESAGDAAVWIRHDGDESEYENLLSTTAPFDPDSGMSPSPDAGAAVLGIYTAAFAGTPNAALISHTAILSQNAAMALVQRVSSETVYLNAGPLFHVASLMTALATWHLGGVNVFTPRVDAEELCRLVDAEKATLAFLMPPTMDQMIESNSDGRYELSSLRSIPYKRAWNEMVTVDDSPWAQAPGGYGQTELMGLATCNALGGEAIATHGRSSPFVRIRIVDDSGSEVAQGETGEIVVRGPTVMNGYLNRPELTAERSRDGWHHTGDLGRREADGSLSFIGPMTRIIKSAAENIYPAEVEAAIRSHPGVADVCVLGVPDDKWRQRVKAVVVLSEDGSGLDADAIVEHVRNRIASYKKPREVVFAASLPRTGLGLVDRDAADAEYGGGGYPGA